MCVHWRAHATVVATFISVPVALEAISITVHWTLVGYPVCQNGGVCRQGVCHCPPGFEGPQCETGTAHVMWCVSMHGCERLYVFNTSHLSCPVYQYHPELEPCGVYYCSNGGVCVNGTSCQCAAGFGGENCNLAFCECHACGVVLSSDCGCLYKW